MAGTKTNKKIVIIGPVYPFKGGISHYTGLLCRAMRNAAAASAEGSYDVSMISYKMQYPKILFKKEQRDYEDDAFKVEGTEYLINTASIYNIRKCAAYINRLSPALVIIQWWHPYFAPCYSILAGHLKAPVLFICHNVYPHERFPMDRFLTRRTLKHGDYFILHSSLEADELKGIIPDAKYAVNLHPTYKAFNFEGNLNENTHEDTLLFFGFVRPYKGLKILIEAMRLLPDVIHLNVVGDFGGNREEYDAMIREYDLIDRIEIHDGYVPDREVGGYFQACDAVVLPYIDATQSGIAQIAFGLEKPVIATKVGGLPEVVTDGVTGVLCEPSNVNALANAIKKFYELKQTTDFSENIRNDSGRFSWEHMVHTIEELTGIDQ